jgi:hypothetical protein
MTETRSCGCVINARNVKLVWCGKHATPDVHQTEEYYH